MNEISVRMENRAVFVRPGDPKVLSWSLDLNRFDDLATAALDPRELDKREWPTLYVKLDLTKQPKVQIWTPARMSSGSVALKAFRPHVARGVSIYNRGKMFLSLNELGEASARVIWSSGNRQELAAINIYQANHEPFLEISFGLPHLQSRYLLERSHLLLKAKLNSFIPELSVWMEGERGTTVRLPDCVLAACCSDRLDIFFFALLLREEDPRKVESWVQKIFK